ncbi:Crp/Fnr family transcriptional regulator [Phycicoccus flavus]|uniref:Crp/Fnr family transcriptional regulator n=1 Tax=Phycicoccus flavus TaxID=2502783 RepID=UPI000FEBBC11|nr:Crp/Fnr family transcriptional regulator [Phycicoccus flavus]NHA67558.1 Crp/Fnr family transcriptional regulator [Phycicoccus flavus]
MDWPLLAPLPAEARDAVLAVARSRTFARGEVVFHEGDPANALHLVRSGHLIVRVTAPDGERATLNLLGPGDHVGELALIPSATPQQRSATVLALDRAETLALPAAAFHDLCARHPPVNGLLVGLLAERVRELSARLLETMHLGLDRRVYRCLLRLADVYAGGAGPVVLPVTQEQLADLVGGTRPSVNQVLGRLQEQGVIRLARGRTVLLDLPALTRKAGA